MSFLTKLQGILPEIFGGSSNKQGDEHEALIAPPVMGYKAPPAIEEEPAKVAKQANNLPLSRYIDLAQG